MLNFNIVDSPSLDTVSQDSQPMPFEYLSSGFYGEVGQIPNSRPMDERGNIVGNMSNFTAIREPEEPFFEPFPLTFGNPEDLIDADSHLVLDNTLNTDEATNCIQQTSQAPRIEDSESVILIHASESETLDDLNVPVPLTDQTYVDNGDDFFEDTLGDENSNEASDTYPNELPSSIQGRAIGQHEIEDPTTMPGFVPVVEDVSISLSYIHHLREATLNSPIEPLDPDMLHSLRNPPQAPATLTPDEHFGIDVFLRLTNSSEKAYEDIRQAYLRRDSLNSMLSYYEVKQLIERLSGVSEVMRDMCVNSCIGYTGPYAEWHSCPHCQEPRYESNQKGQIPRKQFMTIPLGPQIQALFRSKLSAENVQYRRNYTEKVFQDLKENNGIKTMPYRDFFDGTEYLSAADPVNGTIKEDDVVLVMSIDGAQLYQYKTSECWIYIWVILDLSPDRRYKTRHVLPGGFIPGPYKPKNIDSFVFPGLYHLSALQNKGLKIWNAFYDRVSTSHPFLALVTADGPAMATLSGFVGHHGRCHCRFHCPLVGRHKPGASHYYPARMKPNDYNVQGCDHDDVDLEKLLRNFDSYASMELYFSDVKLILNAKGKTHYEKIRLKTGLCKPSIFLGLHPDHTLSIPGLFAGDSMHLAALNLPDLFLAQWRATLPCDRTDSKILWKWAVLADDITWKRHGQAVADTTPYIPGSFDRPPRNPADKMNSGYKAWEFLLYLFGLGPALFYKLLPDEYWANFCRLVRAIRLLLQTEIRTDELDEAHSLLLAFSDKYEELYVQRRTDRLHMVRASIHTPSHMPPETICIGPSAGFAQWTMERIIGSLTSEIKLHSNPYANLSQRGLRRCQVNALKSIIPDLEEAPSLYPRGSQDIGHSYVLLIPSESKPIAMKARERDAIAKYLHGIDPSINVSRYFSVKRWGRLRLPNGQIARSRWKEDRLPRDRVRTARNVKVIIDDIESFAEVHFYLYMTIKTEVVALVMASFFGPPDAALYQASSKTYISIPHNRDVDVRVFRAEAIHSVVMIAPDHGYKLGQPLGSENVNAGVDRYFVMEKPGLKLSSLIGEMERDSNSAENSLPLTS